MARQTLVEHLFVSGTPNTLLYRSDVVRGRNPFFPTGCWHEDTEVFFEILGEHDFGFVHGVLTFTRRENESLTTAIRLFDPEHRLDKLVVDDEVWPPVPRRRGIRGLPEAGLDAYYDYLGRLCMYRTPARFLGLSAFRAREGRATTRSQPFRATLAGCAVQTTL